MLRINEASKRPGCLFGFLPRLSISTASTPVEIVPTAKELMGRPFFLTPAVFPVFVEWLSINARPSGFCPRVKYLFHPETGRMGIWEAEFRHWDIWGELFSEFDVKDLSIRNNSFIGGGILSSFKDPSTLYFELNSRSGFFQGSLDKHPIVQDFLVGFLQTLGHTVEISPTKIGLEHLVELLVHLS